MLMTDLQEIKRILEIDPDDKSEDLKLSFIIEQASSWIGEILNKPNFDLKTRTEYYNGTGSQRLLLRSRPVYTNPVPQVFVDRYGNFGSTSGAFTQTNSELTYGVDFCLQIDQEDGSSRCGILIRTNDYWNKRWVRQPGYLSPYIAPSYGSIKCIYSAGYTVDNLPAVVRLAMNLLVAKLRYVFPLGLELNSESYEERNIGIAASQKNYILALVTPMIRAGFGNWKW